MLLAWHEVFEVSEYERHRNLLIQVKPGNRNPFVDEPVLAAAVAFAVGIGWRLGCVSDRPAAETLA